MINEQTMIEFARIMQANKPYLLAIENEVQDIQHGEVTVRIEVRNGNVEKMQFIDEKRTWLREKALPTVQEQTTVVMNFVQSIPNV